MTGVLHIAALEAVVIGVGLLALCIVRARDNAAKRKARRAMSAEALELALMRREFDRIVAASYARKDHHA